MAEATCREEYTYQVGKITFIVTPVYKDEGEPMERLHPSEYKRLRETFGHITDDELGAVPLDGVLSADEMAQFIPGLFALKEKMPKKGRLVYKLLPEEVKAELDAFISSLKTDCKYIGDLVNEYAEARKAYYTERLICEILMALEQNAVNMGMEYDDCQKAMGGDLSKAAKKEWYLRHKDRGMEP